MIYLDNATTTFPKPQAVKDIVQVNLTNAFGTPGRGPHTSALRANVAVENVRRDFSVFFGVLDAFRVVFTYSATDALNMCIKGFLDEGDHVLISSMEHNSVLRPLKGLENQGKITLDYIACDKKGYILMDDLEEKLKQNPKLVIVSHASNVTGAVQSIYKIGQKVRGAGAYFLVDAAQTAGVLPIHMSNDWIDFLAFSGHKGIFGLQGTGGLILGSRIEKLRPWREGGTGFDSESETQPVNWPETFEAGTHNVFGIISMGEGLRFIQEQSLEKIARMEKEKIQWIWEEFSQYENIVLYGPSPEEERVGVLSFRILGWDPEDIGKILAQNYGIQVRSGLQCSPLAHKRLETFPEGTIRVSPGIFSTEQEICHFLKAIETICMTEVHWF